MRRFGMYFLALIAATTIVACGDDRPAADSGDDVELATSTPEVTFTPEGSGDVAGKPQGPLTVAYRIIGEPVVGQPVAVELKVHSAFGSDQPIDVSYRINDATAMRLAESQPQKVTMAAATDEQDNAERVTIIPMREGRLYLNVTLAAPSVDASMSTVTAIPIQVGEAPRAPEENGEATTDADGEAIRSLPADES